MPSLLDLLIEQQNPTAGLLSTMQASGLPADGSLPTPVTANPSLPTPAMAPPSVVPLPFSVGPYSATRETAGPVEPGAAPTPSAPQQNGFLARIFAGDPIRGLTPEQNASLRREALLTAGMSMLANPDAPPLQAFAMGVLQARQATAQSAGALLDEQNRQARVNARAAVFADSNLTELQKYEALRRIATKEGDDKQVMVLNDVIKELREAEAAGVGELTTIEGPDGAKVSVRNMPDGSVRDLAGNVVTAAPTGPPEVSADFSDAAAFFGISPEQAAALPDMQKRAFLQWVDRWKMGHEPRGTSVTVEAPTDKALLGIAADRFKAYTETADQMNKIGQTLNAAERLLDEGTRTGRVEEMTAPIREVAAAFGVDSKGMSNQQALRALANQLRLVAAEQMKGSLSNEEQKILEQTTVNIGNITDANRQIIAIARKMQDYANQRAQAAEDYLSENETGVGFTRHMRDFEDRFGADKKLLDEANNVLR